MRPGLTSDIEQEPDQQPGGTEARQLDGGGEGTSGFTRHTRLRHYHYTNILLSIIIIII